MASKNPIASADDDVYEVERILKKRRHSRRGTLYHVKWRNFPSSANTWEPACNFPQKLIDDFESNRKRKVSRITSSNNIHTGDTLTPTASTAVSSEQHHILSSTSSPSSSFTISCSSMSTVSSTLTSPFSESRQKRAKACSRRNSTLSRQQQVQLQMHIQQRQNSSYLTLGKQQLAVFNPVASHYLPKLEEIVYEAKLTKEPIMVTDVTAQEQTVTISECKTPEGFFSV